MVRPGRLKLWISCCLCCMTAAVRVRRAFGAMPLKRRLVGDSDAHVVSNTISALEEAGSHSSVAGFERPLAGACCGGRLHAHGGSGRPDQFWGRSVRRDELDPSASSEALLAQGMRNGMSSSLVVSF